MSHEKYDMDTVPDNQGKKQAKALSNEIAEPTKEDGDIKPLPPSKPYAGMSKEMVLLHSQTKCWVVFRNICIYFFVICWLALIVLGIALIFMFPRCQVAKGTDWWQTTSVYNVFTKSFQDTNGDGMGDVKGVTNRLDYFKYLGVGTIILDTLFAHGNQNHTSLEPGYDVTNFTAITPLYGTMTDVDDLIKRAHEKDVRILMTFIPNHTGDKHPWFIQSRTNNTNQYKNYYVWADCGTNGTTPPNNWVSLFGGSAWKYDATRKQCYLHHGTEFEPDLNLRNLQVQKEIEDSLEFWLEKGVDGFYLPRASLLVEDFDMRNEPKASSPSLSATYDSLIHTYTQNLPDSFDLINRWRRLINDFSKENKQPKKFLLLEGMGNLTKKFFDSDSAIEFVNPALLSVKADCGGKCIKDLVEKGMKEGAGYTTNWPISVGSDSRPSSRLGDDYTNALRMLSLLLPGTAISYYGDEIGLGNSTGANLVPKSDAFRSPMLWSNASEAGFTTAAKAWLPISSDYTDINVQAMKSNPNSSLNMYKNLTAIRQGDAMKSGNFHYAVVNDNIFSFVKEWDGKTRYLVAINFGKVKSTDDYPAVLSTVIPPKAKVAMTTEKGFSVKKGDSVSTTALVLEPKQGIVLTWDYVIKETL